MSATTDWLSAVGGVLGAVGGPAGLWAAWHQIRVDRRRRYGPPEELIDLLGKMIDLAGQVSFQYRSSDWLRDAGGHETADRVKELCHPIHNEDLKNQLQAVTRTYTLIRMNDTRSAMSDEDRIRIVQAQEKHARQLKERSEEALKLLRRHL
ncbi:hypothetical protein [Streptomyces sp. NPDC048581]|uniref:hypothetical protein n=1 Tax=unclassified Streptomyces TaxID=2593676 RepID=UPI00371303A1